MDWKERLPFLVWTVGGLLLAAGLIGGGITGRLSTPYLAGVLAGAALIALGLHLSSDLIRTWMVRRSTRYGVNVAIMIAIVLAIAVLIEGLSFNYYRQVDLTEDKLNSLSDQTVQILKGLETRDQRVQVTAFLDETQRGRARSFLDRYAYQTGRFRYELIDLDRNPLLARQFDVTAYGTLVVESGGNQQRVQEASEQAIANAILRVTRSGKKVVYFLKGHGENDPENTESEGYSQVKRAIELENMEVKDLLLLRAEKVPDDAAVVIVSGPQKPLHEEELKRLSTYVKRGGKVLFMVDPQTEANLNPFLADYGLLLQEDVIVDRLSGLLGEGPLTPVITQYEPHQITEDFRTASFFPLARSIRVMEGNGQPEGVSAGVLALTSPESWAETDLETLAEGEAELDEEKDLLGPVPVAAHVDVEAEPSDEVVDPDAKSKRARLVVFGNSRFARNDFLEVSGNRDLFMNSLSWLAEEEDLISIRPRERQGGGPIFLTAAQSRLVFFLPVVGLPGAVLLVGLIVYRRRRRAR